jgi:hypothetical protein
MKFMYNSSHPQYIIDIIIPLQPHDHLSSIIHTCNQVKIYRQYLILTKIIHKSNSHQLLYWKMKECVFSAETQNFFAERRKQPTYIRTYIYIYIYIYTWASCRWSDGEDPHCCCCLQFMVKPYSVIMECIKGMNCVSCPVEREREKKILLMTTTF